MEKQREIQKTLQVLLWLWFGLTTSFVAVNVVNIARLETRSKAIETDIKIFKEHIRFSQLYSKNK